MFNALISLLGVLVDVLVSVAKKLVGLAFLLALLTLSVIVTLILVLDHVVN